MRINYKIFGAFLFIIAVGICAGSFFETSMASSEKSGFFDALSSFFGYPAKADAENSNLFSENLFSSLGYFLPVLGLGYISAFLPFLLPLIPLYIFTRGVSVGFSAAAILETFGLRGILHILISLMPAHLVQLPVFCFLGIISIRASFKTLAFIFSAGRKSSAMGRTRKALQSGMRKYSLFYLEGSVLIVISCLMQEFLLQSFLLQ